MIYLKALDIISTIQEVFYSLPLLATFLIVRSRNRILLRAGVPWGNLFWMGAVTEVFPRTSSLSWCGGDDDYGDYDYFIQIDVLVSAYLRFSNICVSELFSRIVMMTTSTETGGGLMQMPGFRWNLKSKQNRNKRQNWSNTQRIQQLAFHSERTEHSDKFSAFSGLTGETTSPMTSSKFIFLGNNIKLIWFWCNQSIIFSGQNCMTYMEYRNPIFQAVRYFPLLFLQRKTHFGCWTTKIPKKNIFSFSIQYRDYFWNDSDCTNDVAHYICVKVTIPLKQKVNLSLLKYTQRHIYFANTF